MTTKIALKSQYSKNIAGIQIGAVSLFYGINVLMNFLRDVVFATTFGATKQLDILLIGVSFVRTTGMLLIIAISSALIPIFAPMVSKKEWGKISNGLVRGGIQG